MQNRFNVPNEVVDGLYYGNVRHAKDKEMLQELGITHIVNCYGEKVDSFEEYYDFLDDFLPIPIRDGNVDIKGYIDRVLQFIDGAISSGKRVFVHCKNGSSRSGAFVVAYIMRTKDMNFEDAWDFVRQRRAVCCPNQYFRAQIIDHFGELSDPENPGQGSGEL